MDVKDKEVQKKITCAICQHLDETTQMCDVLKTYVLLNKKRDNCVKNKRFVERAVKVEKEQQLPNPYTVRIKKEEVPKKKPVEKKGMLAKLKSIFTRG
jgi:hypothetical protein